MVVVVIVMLLIWVLLTFIVIADNGVCDMACLGGKVKVQRVGMHQKTLYYFIKCFIVYVQVSCLLRVYAQVSSLLRILKRYDDLFVLDEVFCYTVIHSIQLKRKSSNCDQLSHLGCSAG